MTEKQIEDLNRYLRGSLSILQGTYDMLEQQRYIFEEKSTDEIATEEFIDGVDTMDYISDLIEESISRIETQLRYNKVTKNDLIERIHTMVSDMVGNGFCSGLLQYVVEEFGDVLPEGDEDE